MQFISEILYNCNKLSYSRMDNRDGETVDLIGKKHQQKKKKKIIFFASRVTEVGSSGRGIISSGQVFVLLRVTNKSGMS